MLAAVRDTRPIYYQRYMIDYNNKPAADQQGARDRINWFFSMDYAGRRQYAEQTATDAFYESMSWRWPNWAKALLQQQGRRGRSDRRLHELPGRLCGVGLAGKPSMNGSALLAA